MASPKRTETQRTHDKAIISSLMARNNKVRDIATELNRRNKEEGVDYSLSFQQVHYDMKKILAEWKNERSENIDELIENELAKIDEIERECWIAWEKSKEGKQKIQRDGGVVNADGDLVGTKISKIELDESYGDTKYLDRIQWCIEKRTELLGLKTVHIDYTSKGESVVPKTVDLKNIDTDTLEKLKASLNGHPNN